MLYLRNICRLKTEGAYTLSYADDFAITVTSGFFFWHVVALCGNLPQTVQTVQLWRWYMVVCSLRKQHILQQVFSICKQIIAKCLNINLIPRISHPLNKKRTISTICINCTNYINYTNYTVFISRNN